MRIVYFHDSVAMVVYAFDFDLETGNISNKRLLIDRRDSFGEPDGMVVEYVPLPLFLPFKSYLSY
jgi:sugar lactone lactonase YvrE